MDNDTNHFFRLVVPNYNNIAYIKKCLDSIMTQTFKDFICIVVDDHSTDDSKNIGRIYQKKFPDNIVFKQLDKRGYPGTARNVALNLPIKSEYTWFIDSDDWLFDDKVLQNIHETIIKNNFPDVVRCSYMEQWRIEKQVFKPEDSNIDSIVRRGLAPWKTCHRSSFNVRFPENCLVEDIMYALELFDKVNPQKISVEKRPCYVYNRMSSTSLWANKENQKTEIFKLSHRKLIESLTNAKFNTELCRKQAEKIINRTKVLCK